MKILLSLSLFLFICAGSSSASPPVSSNPGSGLIVQTQISRNLNRTLFYFGDRERYYPNSPSTLLDLEPKTGRVSLEGNLGNGLSIGLLAQRSVTSFTESQRFLLAIGRWRWDTIRSGVVTTRLGILYTRDKQISPPNGYFYETSDIVENTCPVFLLSGAHQISAHLRLYGTMYTNPLFWLGNFYGIFSNILRHDPLHLLEHGSPPKDGMLTFSNAYQAGFAFTFADQIPLSFGLGIANVNDLELYVFLALDIP